MKRLGALMILGVALLWGAALLRDAGDLWIDRTALPPLAPETSVEVRDAHGTLLRAYTVADGRWRLAPDTVDPLYVEMLLAWEDRRFRDHAGVDPRAVLRAAWQGATHGAVVSGASTLTMQVARLLEEGQTGSWSGKLRQTRLALALERQLSKDQILQLYLTLAPMGGNIEGVRAAALAYFGREPLRLTPAQAALLVALPQSPEARRPDRHPQAARAARNRVLSRMEALGLLTPEAAATARAEALPSTRRPFPALAPHLADRALARAPGLPRHDLTIDAALQARMEALATSALQGQRAELSIAILVADHRDGRILASVGSRGYAPQGQGFVDMTQAVRSPGSTLKPLIYALAFDRGLAHPETVIDDVPTDFGGYAPHNFDGYFRGPVRLREALQMSLNLPAVALTEAIGPARLMAGLKRGGVTPALPAEATPGLAIALGGLGTSLQDLTQLYAGLANGGTAQPLWWRQGDASAPGARITQRAAAWQVTDILAGLAPPPGAPQAGLAYKTGTSYGHRDAWAIGYDGAHVIGVWVGRPDGTPVPGAFGGEEAAPVLFRAFSRLGQRPVPLPPAPPETLIATSGDLPQPLRHFYRRTLGPVPDADAPEMAFPPDGAVLEAADSLPVRVRHGTAPYTWLINGAPVLTASRRADALLPAPGPGFADVTVIDAAGRSARASVQLD